MNTPTISTRAIVFRRRSLLMPFSCISGFRDQRHRVMEGFSDTPRERGLSIPKDVIVAGFDDIPEASGKYTTLRSSVDLSMIDVSLAILAQVVEAGQHINGIVVTVPVRLIERGSTAAIL